MILAGVIDAPLFVVPRVLDALRAYQASAPPGLPDALAATLLAGIEAHPTKFWVMTQFQKTLARIPAGDAATRDHVCKELETLMDLLGIRSSDGVLGPDRR